MGTNLLLAINIEKPLCQITITMKMIFESHAVMLCICPSAFSHFFLGFGQCDFALTREKKSNRMLVSNL